MSQSQFFINKQKNKILNQLQNQMKNNKRKKSRDSTKKKQDIPQQPKQKMVKFNLSYDNLKCFINDKHPKTDRKRISNKYNFNLTGGKKYRQDLGEDEHVQVYHKIIRQYSPDPSRQASNQILEQIQKNGLRCVWNQIEQTKTQFSNEEEWQQKQLLHQTFSECSSSYNGKNNSHASTIDRFSGYYNQQIIRGYSQPSQLILSSVTTQFLPQTTMTTSQYILNQKIKYYDNSVFEIDPLSIGNDPRTTLMIKNIPNKYTIQDLSHQIDHSFENSYDFLYLPCDIKNNCNVGYGFINFVNTEILLEFYKKFHNKKWIKFRSDKICVLTYARLQGLSSLIEHFQNSKVLNHKDKRYQPIIKDIRECKKIETLIKQQKSQQFSVNL